MITSEYTKPLVRRKVTLEIEETRCLLVHILYFLGVKLKEVKQEYKTLLEAENAYDAVCNTLVKGGYDSTDQ